MKTQPHLFAGCILAFLFITNARAAVDCYLDGTCSETVPDLILSSDSAEVTHNGAGMLRITKVGYDDVNTSIPWNHGSTIASAVLQKIRQSTCVASAVAPIGSKVAPPGEGHEAGSGKCGSTSRTVAYKYKLSYNASGGGSQTQTYNAKPDEPESGSDPCGPQRIGTTTCGGKL